MRIFRVYSVFILFTIWLVIDADGVAETSDAPSSSPLGIGSTVDKSAVGLSYTTGFYGGAWMDILRGTINLPGRFALEPTVASVEDPDFDLWSIHYYLALRWSTRFYDGGYRFYFACGGGAMHGLVGPETMSRSPKWHALWYGGVEFLAGERGTLSLEVGGGRQPSVVDPVELPNQNWYLAVGGHLWLG